MFFAQWCVINQNLMIGFWKQHRNHQKDKEVLVYVPEVQ